MGQPSAAGIVSSDPWAPITPGQWDELRVAWPNGARLTVAFQLARDVETCCALLRGDPVVAEHLDDVPLVRLEQVQPADAFAVEAA